MNKTTEKYHLKESSPPGKKPSATALRGFELGRVHSPASAERLLGVRPCAGPGTGTGTGTGTGMWTGTSKYAPFLQQLTARPPPPPDRLQCTLLGSLVSACFRRFCIV